MRAFYLSLMQEGRAFDIKYGFKKRIVVAYIYNILRKLFFLFLEMTADWFQPHPTDRESELINRLRKRVLDMAPLPATTNENSAWWLQSRKNLRKLILSKDPRSFLRWEVVVMNMFPAFNRYLLTEFNSIKNLQDYNTLWKNAITETHTGKPIKHFPYRFTSGATIHAAYHIKKFLDLKFPLADIDVVFEFGGGYGKLCAVLNKLGYCGNYILFDLPEFSALQEFYLGLEGLPVNDPNKLSERKRINCLSEIQDIHKIQYLLEKRCMFVATWSISETPLSFRKYFDFILQHCDYFLIAYFATVNLGTDEEVDNFVYFADFIKTMTHIDFSDFPVDHMPIGNRYLLGKPRNR